MVISKMQKANRFDCEANRFEIYWINLNSTIGSEITKIRPCVIISPNEIHNLSTRLIAPITSKGFDAPYRINFRLLDKEAKILCDQIRCVSLQKLHQKIGELPNDVAQKLSALLCEMFAL
ncbi:type II toxin-antitoxin system PemK/MazF family toxin [uncultured Helicobacter sp.]|uniref:type II toxin-antitoxin system PemK/MazF family toxin n=1 Tax=uncultured Helicobacter sp. TaxID=175537 RepID=UPI00374EF76F